MPHSTLGECGRVRLNFGDFNPFEFVPSYNNFFDENVTQASHVLDNEVVKGTQNDTTSNDNDQNMQAAIKVKVCRNESQLNRCRDNSDIEHVTLCLSSLCYYPRFNKHIEIRYLYMIWARGNRKVFEQL